jgi:hypothetical protein
MQKLHDLTEFMKTSKHTSKSALSVITLFAELNQSLRDLLQHQVSSPFYSLSLPSSLPFSHAINN